MDLSERATDFRGERHFWEAARAMFLRRLMRDYPVFPEGALLDFGCGDGYLLNGMMADFPKRSYTALDIALDDETAARMSHAGGARVVNRPEAVRESEFQVVTMFDVLEHLEDDEGTVNRLGQALPEGAMLFLSVPAFQCLFGEHDRELRHFRRYERRKLTDLLQRNGFQVLESGYFFAILPVVRLLLHLAGRRDGIGNGAVRPLWLNRLLEKWLRADAAICRWLARRGVILPGLSGYAVCVRRS